MTEGFSHCPTLGADKLGEFEILSVAIPLWTADIVLTNMDRVALTVVGECIKRYLDHSKLSSCITVTVTDVSESVAYNFKSFVFFSPNNLISWIEIHNFLIQFTNSVNFQSVKFLYVCLCIYCKLKSSLTLHAWVRVNSNWTSVGSLSSLDSQVSTRAAV